jgi:hypothetical protein
VIEPKPVPAIEIAQESIQRRGPPSEPTAVEPVLDLPVLDDAAEGRALQRPHLALQ